MCRRGVDDLALIPEKHISVCPSLRGLDDDYEEVKAAAQETSTLGAPGYSDFCGAVNSTQGETLHHIQGVPKNALSEWCWSHSALAQSPFTGTPCVWRLIFLSFLTKY